jgi:hypothetical protein
VNTLVKQKYAFTLSWPPVLVLGIILLAGELVGGRYRAFSSSTFAILIVVAVLLTGWTVFAENHSRYERAVFSTTLLVAYVTIVEIVGLVHLLSLLLSGDKGIHGLQLLGSGVYSWVSNVLTFGLWYWLIDRGGPHVRARRGHGRAEFLFPEMAASDIAGPQWVPGLIEYMYLSFTDATAFSPTDTLPLSARARLLMTVESAMSLLTIALVTARAVNILS